MSSMDASIVQLWGVILLLSVAIALALYRISRRLDDLATPQGPSERIRGLSRKECVELLMKFREMVQSMLSKEGSGNLSSRADGNL